MFTIHVFCHTIISDVIKWKQIDLKEKPPPPYNNKNGYIVYIQQRSLSLAQRQSVPRTETNTRGEYLLFGNHVRFSFKDVKKNCLDTKFDGLQLPE